MHKHVVFILFILLVSGCASSNDVSLDSKIIPCDQTSKKNDNIQLNGKGNTVEWTQILSTYCSSENDIEIELIKNRGNNLVIKEIFDPEYGVARCICPLEIVGSINNLKQGKYSLTFIFENRYVDQEEFINKYSFTVPADLNQPIEFQEEFPETIMNGYRESMIINDYSVELVYNEEKNKIAFFLDAVPNDDLVDIIGRISIEFYDWDKDDNVDWVRLTDYYSELTDFGSKRTDSISFYRGDGELQHMLERYGSHLEGLRNRKIEKDEIGVTKYTGGYNGLFFKPIRDQRTSLFFELGDNLILFSKNPTSKFYPKFEDEFKDVFSTRIVDMPDEWKNLG